jgi:hypothetical protein
MGAYDRLSSSHHPKQISISSGMIRLAALPLSNRLQVSFDLFEQIWISLLLPRSFQPIVDRGNDLGVPPFFGTNDVVLCQPITHRTPCPQWIALLQMAFRRRKSTGAAFSADVLGNELPASVNPPGDFGRRNQIALINANHVSAPAGTVSGSFGKRPNSRDFCCNKLRRSTSV